MNIKILIDAHIFGGIGQGSVTYLEGLYGAFCKKYGHIYTIYFAVNAKSDLPLSIQQYIPQEQIIELKSKNSFSRIFLEFPKIIKTYKFDFAHFQYIVPILFSSIGCRFIVTTHDILFNHFPKEFPVTYRIVRNFLFKKSLEKSAIKLTVSEYSKEKIADFYNINPDDIAITPNAVDSIFLQHYNKEESQQFIEQTYGIKPKFILYVSRIEPRKNQAVLLQAYKDLQLCDQSINLIFIGSVGIECPSFKQLMDTLTIHEKQHVFWLEKIPFSNLLEFYRAAELFVYPSKAEGFGIPPLEAAAVGTKVLVANNTAMREFDCLEDYVFNEASIDDLKNQILHSLSNNDVSQKLSKISKIIEAKYSWERSADVLHLEIQKKIT